MLFPRLERSSSYVHSVSRQPRSPFVCFLTIKLAFLTAITTARRVSKLAALSYRDPFCILYEDRMILQPSSALATKVISKFHINWEVVVPWFSQSPEHMNQLDLRLLNLVSLMSIYCTYSGFNRYVNPITCSSSLRVLGKRRQHHQGS